MKAGRVTSESSEHCHYRTLRRRGDTTVPTCANQGLHKRLLRCGHHGCVERSRLLDKGYIARITSVSILYRFSQATSAVVASHSQCEAQAWDVAVTFARWHVHLCAFTYVHLADLAHPQEEWWGAPKSRLSGEDPIVKPEWPAHALNSPTRLDLKTPLRSTTDFD